jgi:hypothetical protein
MKRDVQENAAYSVLKGKVVATKGFNSPFKALLGG